MTVAISDPLVPDSFRERAEAIGALVQAESSASDRLGRLTDKVVDALMQAGLFAILLPKSTGGLGGTRLDMFEACEALALADGAAGWCVSLCNATNIFIWRGLGEEGRAEVFGHGPVACWASLLPKARPTAADGGFRISGKFGWGTASSFARWISVSSLSKDAEGRNLYRAYLAPKADVEFVEGSWDVLGLRATSSLDYDIVDKFVPARRSFEYLSEGLSAAGPLSAMEMAWLNQVGLTAFASGVARRILLEFIAAATKTKRMAAEGLQSESLVVQTGVGEFEGRLSAARSYYRQLVIRQDEAVSRGESIGPPLRAELSLGAQTLTRAAREVALFAYENSGGSVVYASSPIQRGFRDLLTGLKHATFSPHVLARIGRVRLGLPPLPMPL